jgi:hypothetical protein
LDITGKARPFDNIKKGRVSKYSDEEKRIVCQNFLKANHTNKTSLKGYIAHERKNTPTFVCAKTLRGWLRDPVTSSLGQKVNAYQYKRVPYILKPHQKRWALNFAQYNMNRDWNLCGFSDEACFETGNTTKLLKKKKIRFYTSKKNKMLIPSMLNTSWSGIKVNFFVIVGYDTKTLVTMENKTWTPAPTQPNVPIERKIDERKVAVDNGHTFVKRNLPKRKRRPKAPEPNKTLNAKEFIVRCAPAIVDWYHDMLEKIKNRKQRKQIYHFHVCICIYNIDNKTHTNK